MKDLFCLLSFEVVNVFLMNIWTSQMNLFFFNSSIVFYHLTNTAKFKLSMSVRNVTLFSKPERVH